MCNLCNLSTIDPNHPALETCSGSIKYFEWHKRWVPTVQRGLSWQQNRPPLHNCIMLHWLRLVRI